MYFTLVILQSSIEKTNHVQAIPGSTRTMLCFKYHLKTLLFCELLALTRWPHIFLYFSLTECQKSCSHPMTLHFLSLCSHRMHQPVGGRALHPYPLHIWLPPPRITRGSYRLWSLLIQNETKNIAFFYSFLMFLQFCIMFTFLLTVIKSCSRTIKLISTKVWHEYRSEDGRIECFLCPSFLPLSLKFNFLDSFHQ